VIGAHELIVDSFAGGGGASLGIEMATGRSPDIAINHDAEAIAMHARNHPGAHHYCESVWQVDPVEATAGRPVGLMWASPDCTHHSRAKGGKPVSNKRRGLAWAVIRWAQAVRPRVIALENVSEWLEWGPITRATQRPNPDRKGATFRAWVRKLERLGYDVQWRELRAADFGGPTTRRRLFLVARCDGLLIVWPKPTHGKGTPRTWRSAGECMQWDTPTRSIFGRPKPLADNTLRRVANGLRKYVLECDRPYVVGDAAHFITEHANASNPRSWNAAEPLRTVCANVKGGHFALVSAFLAKHYSERKLGEVMAASLVDPLPTITTVDHNAQVTASLGTEQPDDVRAFLVAYYGNEQDGGSLFRPMRTLTTKDRYGLVTVHGREYVITDIHMRMLTARELYRAQGFPDSYVIDHGINPATGARVPLTLTAQKRMVGNSVAPDVARAIIAAQFGVALTQERAA
jgi:DNA (cytosine-5)-methyltransferase 1